MEQMYAVVAEVEKYKDFVPKDCVVYDIEEKISETRSGYIFNGQAVFTKPK